MHVALALYGLPRHPRALMSIRKMIDVLQAHGITNRVFCHYYDLEHIVNPRTKENCAVTPPDFSVLGPIAEIQSDDQCVVVDEVYDVHEYNPLGDPWRTNFESPKNLLRQLYSLKQVTTMWSGYHETFDAVLCLRLDLLYQRFRPDLLTQAVHDNKLYLPNYKCSGGYHDRWAIGPPSAMRVYGNRLDKAFSYAQTRKLHSEKFLKYALRGVRVKKSAGMRNNRIRADGRVQKDQGFWMKIFA